MKLFVGCRETGDLIEEVKSFDEGIRLILKYEEEDRKAGLYEEDFYDVLDEDGCSADDPEIERFWNEFCGRSIQDECKREK